jgi:hypothetical protein
MSARRPSYAFKTRMALAGLCWLAGVFASPLYAAAETGFYLEFRASESDTTERLSLFRDGMAVWNFKRPAAPDLLLKQQLSPEEVKVYLDALRASGIAAARETPPSTMSGQHVRTWTLAVALPGAPARTFAGSDLQAPTLAMGTALRLVRDLSDTLLTKWRDTDPFQERAPAQGDRLKGYDEHTYEVRRYVSEREQYELAGVDQPMTYYIKKGELKLFFKGFAQ